MQAKAGCGRVLSRLQQGDVRRPRNLRHVLGSKNPVQYSNRRDGELPQGEDPDQRQRQNRPHLLQLSTLHFSQLTSLGFNQERSELLRSTHGVLPLPSRRRNYPIHQIHPEHLRHQVRLTRLRPKGHPFIPRLCLGKPYPLRRQQKDLQLQDLPLHQQ